MGQLQPPPNYKPLPVLPFHYEFEHPNIQKMKETPFLKSTVYSYEPSIYCYKTDIFLNSLVGPRMGTKGLFPENYIWKVMKALVDALAFLEARQIRFGDVHEDNIYYDRHSKLFKFLNPHNIQITGYDLTRTGQRFSFLSPELLLALSQYQSSISLYTYQKSDVFALGILLIEVCTLHSSSDLYDPETYNILDATVQYRLNMISQQYYNEKVAAPIRLMVEYDVAHRPLATDLQNMLEQEYKSQQSRPGVMPMGMPTPVPVGMPPPVPANLPSGYRQQQMSPGPRPYAIYPSRQIPAPLNIQVSRPEGLYQSPSKTKLDPFNQVFEEHINN